MNWRHGHSLLMWRQWRCIEFSSESSQHVGFVNKSMSNPTNWLPNTINCQHNRVGSKSSICRSAYSILRVVRPQKSQLLYLRQYLEDICFLDCHYQIYLQPCGLVDSILPLRTLASSWNEYPTDQDRNPSPTLVSMAVPILILESMTRSK
jgi:hypothetical protein